MMVVSNLRPPLVRRRNGGRRLLERRVGWVNLWGGLGSFLLKVVLRYVCPVVRVQFVDRYQRIGILLAFSVAGQCLASVGIVKDYGWTARGSFVDAIQSIS